MEFKDIKLGNRYWCVFKASVVDEKRVNNPDFLMHIGQGTVLSKGAQLNETDGSKLLFVEIAGQRIKHDHVFESPEDAIDKLEVMMQLMAEGLKAVPEQS